MFQVDEYVVYGNNGVCKIKEIGTVKLGNADDGKLYYTLEPLNSKRSTVYTPVDNQKVVMRSILSKEEALKLIDEIPYIEEMRVANDKKRLELYKEAMKKYDCREWVRIIKTLYLRKEQRQKEGKAITGTDERYLKMAEENLFTELTIPLEVSKEEIVGFIEQKVRLLQVS